MKKKQRVFLGFAVIIMAIFTVTGCATLFPPPAEFPSEFWGTWKRDEPAPQNTLTITARTYTLSHQTTHWILDRVSGNTFHMSTARDRNWRGEETIRYVNNGTLMIEPCRGTGMDNCGGIWIRQ